MVAGALDAPVRRNREADNTDIAMQTPASIARHPIHPMLVNFPIGLWNFSLVCDLIGHAAPFDQVQIEGDLEKRDCTVSYSRNARQLAVAVIHRDLAGLRAEVAFERVIANTVKGASDEQRSHPQRQAQAHV